MWFDNMQTPLNTRKTKYAKAIERITGAPAVVWFQCIIRHKMHSNTRGTVCLARLDIVRFSGRVSVNMIS